MKWSVQELNKLKEQALPFEEALALEAVLKQRESEILAVEPVLVKGTIEVNEAYYAATFTISTTLVLPSTRSLEPVDVPLNLDVTELYMTPVQYQNRPDWIEPESVLILENDTVNIQEAVEDHLLLAIPLQRFTEAEKAGIAMPSGNDWAILSEEEYASTKEQQEAEKVDPRFAKLSELFSEEDQD